VRVQTYRDLLAWQKARALVRAIYDATASWPQRETYGLIDQARRAAVSIPANIAEGQGRQGKAEFLHHLSLANGSLHELETHLYIALDLAYLDAAACDALLEQTAEVGRLLNGLMRSLRA
jgi:four helix bundle protein